MNLAKEIHPCIIIIIKPIYVEISELMACSNGNCMAIKTCSQLVSYLL